MSTGGRTLPCLERILNSVSLFPELEIQKLISEHGSSGHQMAAEGFSESWVPQQMFLRCGLPDCQNHLMCLLKCRFPGPPRVLLHRNLSGSEFAF